MTSLVMGQEVYSTDEIARQFKVSVRYVLEEIRRGRLKARKAGRAYLILREDARQWFEALPADSRGQPNGC